MAKGDINGRYGIVFDVVVDGVVVDPKVQGVCLTTEGETTPDDFPTMLGLVRGRGRTSADKAASIRVESIFVLDERDRVVQCGWFAKCQNDATHYEPHPVLGPVPACDRCVEIGR